MALTRFPGKPKRVVVSLISGTSWTVPSDCFYVNVTAIAGGGGSGGAGTSVATAGGAGGDTTFNGTTVAYGGNGGSGLSITLSGSPTFTSITGDAGSNSRGTGSTSGYAYATTLTSGLVTGTVFARPSSGKSGNIAQQQFNTTPGSTITYAIGAGGTAGTGSGSVGCNGNTGGSGRIDLEYFV